ncbi:MAG: hypothetical protein QM767_29725 [Anaeromyxobacter sp.]
MVPEDAPVFEASEDVLDPGALFAVTAPGGVADDPVVAEDRDTKTQDSPVSAIGEDNTVASFPGPPAEANPH